MATAIRLFVSDLWVVGRGCPPAALAVAECEKRPWYHRSPFPGFSVHGDFMGPRPAIGPIDARGPFFATARNKAG